MPDINVVGIISKPGVSAAAMLVPELMEWLEGRGLRLRYDPPTGAYVLVAAYVLPTTGEPASIEWASGGSCIST